MCVRPSICPYIVRVIWYLRIFRKSVERIQVSLKYDKNNEYFTWRFMYTHEVSRCIFHGMRNVYKNAVYKIKTHILCSVTVFENRAVFQTMEKSCRGGQATNNNMTYAHFMLDTWGNKHILRICNTFCLSTSIMVTQRRLDLMLYAHCPSCLDCVSWLDLMKQSPSCGLSLCLP